MSRARIALIGAGQMGREHAGLLRAHPGTELVAACDAHPGADQHARDWGVPFFADYAEMLDRLRPDGAVIALPNALHAEAAIACLERGIPPLLEKPVAGDMAGAARIVAAERDRGVPVLVGHHRRHSPDLRSARKVVADGELGRLVAVNGMTLFDKPARYFDQEWRRMAGGGPLLINLIHDLDAVRFIAGEIESVRAFASNARRGFEVEDTAAVSVRFASGALGNFTISDTAVSPWAWEYTSGQALYFPSEPGACLFLAGTEGSLSVSDLYLWKHAAPGGDWQVPKVRAHRPGDGSATYVNQLDHYLAVIRREAAPVSSAMDATVTLAAILAVTDAAREDRTVTVAEVLARVGLTLPG